MQFCWISFPCIKAPTFQLEFYLGEEDKVVGSQTRWWWCGKKSPVFSVLVPKILPQTWHSNRNILYVGTHVVQKRYVWVESSTCIRHKRFCSLTQVPANLLFSNKQSTQTLCNTYLNKLMEIFVYYLLADQDSLTLTLAIRITGHIKLVISFPDLGMSMFTWKNYW